MHYINLTLPAGVYYAQNEQGAWDQEGGYGGYTRGGSGGIDLSDCDDEAAEYVNQYDISDALHSSHGVRFDCIPRPILHEANAGEPILPAPEGPGGGSGPVAVALSVAGLMGAFAFLATTRFKWMLFGLFSRLSRPEILDQSTRAMLYEAVERDPGIHPRALAQRLELSPTRVLYHLRVLQREGLLTSVGTTGFRHYFLAGRFGSDEMKRRVMLSRPNLQETLRLVGMRPGSSVSEIATSLGCSVGRASRCLRRLANAGLLVVERRGKEVVARIAQEP